MNEKKKNMRGLPKHILSFVLTFVMVFAFMPGEAYALGDPDYITIISNNVSWGTVSGSSSSYQYEGKTITVSASGNSLTITGLGSPIVITATPNSGYAFVRWEDASGNEFSNASFTDTTYARETIIKAVFAPAGEEYPIFIYSGESYQQVKESNKDDVLGNGTVSFDPETNTLTLSGAAICTGAENTTDDAIYCNLPADKTLTIKLIGSNVIGKAPSAFNIASGISSKGGAKLLLKGDENSSLTIYAGESGIKGFDISLGKEGENFEGKLKIYSHKTSIKAGREPAESLLGPEEGEITIYGGDIDIESKENGLSVVQGTINLSDVTLNVTANTDSLGVYHAIKAEEGLNITGSACHIVARARLNSDLFGAIFCPSVTKPEGTKVFGSTEWNAPEESITSEAALDGLCFKTSAGYAKAVILYICSVEQKSGQAATCTEDGWKDYYQCTNTSCSKIYASSAIGTSYADLAAWKASPEGKIERLGHNWNYAASGAALTATCGRDASHTATLTLTATSAIYSGSETYAASLGDTSAWTGAGLSVPTIKYYKATAEGGTEGTEEVTNLTGLAEGNYYAAVTAGTGEDAVTAKAAFEVKEAVQIPASELKNEIEGLALILGGDKDVMLNQFSFWLTNGVRPTELKSAAATAFMYSDYLVNNVQRGGTGAEIPRTILDKLVAHKETQINLLDAIKANDNVLIAAYTDEFFEVLGDVAFEISTDEDKYNEGEDVIIKAESLEAFRQNAIARADASTLVSTHERYSSYMEKFCDLLNLDAHKKSVMMAAFGEWLEDEDADTILNLAVDESWLGKWEFTDEEADEILVMFAKTFYSFTAEASSLMGNAHKAVDGESDKSIEALKTIINEVSPLAYKVYDLMDAAEGAYWADTLTLMDECISDEKALLEKVFNDTVDYSADVQTSYTALRNTDHVWTDATHQTSTGVCLICGHTCSHTGGTATCIAKAKCSVCQAEYGEYAAHNYAYSAEGNVLTAACQADGCNDTHSLTLTANNANYSGTPVTASYGTNEASAWKTATGSDAPTITYEKKDTDSTWSAITSAPVNVGEYRAVAKVTKDSTDYIAYKEFTISKIDITSVTFTAPTVAAAGTPSTATGLAIASAANYTGAISWAPADTSFKYNTVYIATVTLSAKDNYKFADGVTFPTGWTKDASSTETSLVLTKTYDATAKAKITSVTAPSVTTELEAFTTESAQIAALPTSVTVAVEDNSKTSMAITWALKDGATYSTASEAENTFVWTVTATEYANYDTNSKTLTGEVTLKNPVHQHTWNFTADEAVMTATCTGSGDCTVENGKTTGVTLTLTANNANYSGSAVEATMDKTAWEAAGLTAPTVVYEAKTGSALTDGKAVNAGSYTAKITVAGKTATKDFEITKASQEVPATGVGYTINYTDETITAGTDYEVSTSNTSFAAPTDGKVVPGNTYYVRKKGNDNYNPSSWTSITVAARPTAPSGYTAVDPTTVGGANGKITGVTTAMEYSTDNGTSWTAVSGTEITGLSAGKVLLRVKATSSAFASTNVEIALSNPHAHAVDVTKKHVAVPSTCKTKGTKEWYECTDSLCDKKLDKNGNELTSIELDFDSSNHEGTATWTKTATTHKETYNCCGAVKTAENSHISSGAATEESAEVCTVCGYELAEKLPHTHKYASAYSKDATGHWHAATCGHDVKDGFAAHTSSGAATEAKAEVCTVCGYEIAPKLNHNHTYATTYSKDVTGHWYAATCGHNVQGSFSVHTYGDWTVTKLASITEAGEKQRTCSVCGYKEAVATTYDKPVGDTDVDPNAGKIENKTDSSKNGCAADVEITKLEIIEKLELTPEELSRVENGEDIAFYLAVTTEESNNISQSEQKEAEKKLESGEKIGQYLDINLFKIVGNDKSKVSQTNGKIKIEITIPSDIKKVGTDFFIIRVHNGVATKLALTLVSGDTYSFETDQFSTYAIGYKEKSSDSNNDNNSNNNTNDSDNKTEETAPQTGDSNDLRGWFFALIVLLGGILVLLGGILVLVGLKRKEKNSK